MLLYDGSRILILAKTCKLGMAEMIPLRPLQVLDSHNDHGSDPYAFLHIVHGQAGSPTSLFSLWKIRKRTSRRLELVQLRKKPAFVSPVQIHFALSPHGSNLIHGKNRR